MPTPPKSTNLLFAGNQCWIGRLSSRRRLRESGHRAMREILKQLPPQAIVLDLGSGEGSVPAGLYPARLVSGDIQRPTAKPDRFVQLDSARLPFKDAAFDAIILNHSLEHFPDVESSLLEMGRVIKKERAGIYIAVPDSATLADRVYRRIGGAGHVNRFTSLSDLVQLIVRTTGLRHQGTRFLCSSFSILNGLNLGPRRLGRMVRFLGGNERLLALSTLLLRSADHFLHTGASFYGWALYFGDIAFDVDEGPWTNVCVRCGAGHSSAWLETTGRVRRRWLLKSYACPNCGARNYFTSDEAYEFLRRGR